MLNWFERRNTLVFCDFLNRWPTLKQVKRARRSTLETFFDQHNVRRAYLVEKRIKGIGSATSLTEDAAVIRPNQMLVQALVYQQVAWQHAGAGEAPPASLVTVSVDEKPGVQAIANTAPDRPPQAGRHPNWARDHEYVRHATLSILAALDLHDGHIIAQVHERHRSREFIELLKALDAHYPPACTIRIVLDNHSAHISKETQAYLATRPNRFVYVHTPKHGSWLNLVETAFSKMARTFLRHIRVGSKEELKRRILQGIDKMNASSVVIRWRKHDLNLGISESIY